MTVKGERSLEPIKWECESLKDSNGIFLMHAGCGIAVNPVYHDFTMLAYVAHGEGTHKCNDKLFDISEGDIFIVNSGFVHSVYPSPRVQYMEMYYCFLSKKKTDILWGKMKNDFPELKEFFDNASVPYLHIKDNSSKELRSVFVRMIDEFMHCPPGYRNIINDYLGVMLTKIFRRYLYSINNPVLNRNKIVEQVIRYINYNINFGIKVYEIAEAQHMSEEYLCRLFKKHT